MRPDQQAGVCRNENRPTTHFICPTRILKEITMNTRILIAATAAATLSVAGLAHAEGPLEDGRLYIDTPVQAAAAPVSRSTVQAALRSTPAHITALVTEAGEPMHQRAGTQRSRAAVMAEARAAIANGDYFALTALDNSFDGVTLDAANSNLRLARAAR
jgi:hypothetical protein